ncbi:MAG: hypothetical protein AB7T08_02310 [Hyphomonadaceae bacterium]
MPRNPAYAALPDYAALKRANPFRMKVSAAGYSTRAVIDKGDGFFDVMMGWRDDDRVGWREDDGSIIFGDIGGQSKVGWNPQEGHGSVWRLKRDDTLEALMPPGSMTHGTVFEPHKAPVNFGPWGDHIFFVGQTEPGRPGATKPHAVYRVAPEGGAPETFCVVPNNGRIGGGVPGALMPGTFGRAGTPFDGSLFVHSFMNCTIYRVTPDKKIEPFITLDYPDGMIMPQLVIYAPDWWRDYAGELILFGARNASFESARRPKSDYAHWRITPDGKIEPIPDPPIPLRAIQAPKEFGPYAGDFFYVDEGPVDLAQIAGCDEFEEGLPYHGKVMRVTGDGETSVFADNFQGSYTSLVFDRERLLMGVVGRSYCTGEYHEPDGAIYEIRYNNGKA